MTTMETAGSSSSQHDPMTEDSNPRKRSAPRQEQEETLAKQLFSQRNKALNHLLKLSGSHENSVSLYHDYILKSLTQIFFDCIGWKKELFPEEKATFRSKQTWMQAPTLRLQEWCDYCQQKLGPLKYTIHEENWKTMEVVLMIVRNFSFVAGNHRLLAYSSDLVAILVGCMYQGFNEPRTEDTNRTLLSTMAINTLVHLAPYLDVSGQKLLSDRLFYNPHKARDGPAVPDEDTFGLLAESRWGMAGLKLAKRLDVKEDTISDVSKDFVLSLTHEYVSSTWCIFSGLCNTLTDKRAPRQLVLAAIDLLQEFINQARIGIVGSAQLEDNEDELPTTRMILVNMPDSILDQLVNFLLIPRNGPESLDYVDPTKCNVARVPPLKLISGYDSLIDTELRDKTLDVLVPLLEIDSPRMARRLGTDPVKKRLRLKLFDASVLALKARTGRQDAPVSASTLLRELSRAEENEPGLLYIESRVLEIAGKDSRVAQVCWNYLYPPEVEQDEMDVDE